MPVSEQKIQDFWKKNKIYDKSKTLRRGAKRFYFLDGPPYATGHIHIGTAFNKIIKDMYIRFWRMRGFDVWDQPGYDTHGLPIENKVEKKLGFKTKSQIEKFGIDKFNSRCRKFATEFIDVMNGEFADLGVWMDWSSPYLTLSNEYIESAWHTFKVAFEKGLLYKGLYSVHVCPRCETAVAYNEIIYDKVSDPSIFVKFKVKGSRNDFLVIWTTTPWTLPANTGIMVRPEAEYVKVLVSGENLIMAKDLLETVMKKLGKEGKVTATMKGKELVGVKYTHPLADMFPAISKKVEAENGYRVVPSERYVLLTDGSGLVHCAPGHGSEDFEVGKEQNLPIICPVLLNGKFDDSAGKLTRKKVKEGGELVMQELERRGALLYQERLLHDYPFCWRCESKLLLLARPQWFFKVTAIRDKLLAENEKVRWSPEWAKARFKNWLESLEDWPVSRQRYWGIPLPIWACAKCERINVIGSVDELPQKLQDLHRPFIDQIKLKCQCGGEMRRVPDVLDVWFDSGLASWASIGYPRNRKLFEEMWPAELNVEGPDQIRGWWNSQMITSMITFDKSPFKKILFHGFMLDAHGIKMSKSKGNIITPKDVLKKGFSRDHLRFYLLSGAPWDDFYFNWKDMEAVLKNFVIIENTFNFVKTYVKKVEKPGELKPEDRWILSRINNLVREVTNHMETYNGHKSVLEIRDFIIDEFSRVYIKLVRDRVKLGINDDAAKYTLYTVSKIIARLLAPALPYLAEHIHQDLLRPLGETLESVHLASWPLVDRSVLDQELEGRMQIALKVAEYANALRNKQKIKLRWPLKTLIIGGDDKVKAAVVTFAEAIKQLTNVKDVAYGHAKWQTEQDGIKLWLDTELDASLKKEAEVREIIRKLQDLRKASKMVVTDRVVAYVNGADISGFEEEIKKEVGAVKLVVGKVEARKKEKIDFEGRTIEVGIEPK